MNRLALQRQQATLLNKALRHQDQHFRNWAVGVVADLINRAGPAAGNPYLDALADRLTNDADEGTRYTATLALYNMKALAEPAKSALEQAAEKDASHHVREFAAKVLAQIQTAR